MSVLDDWAREYGVSPVALGELRRRMGQAEQVSRADPTNTDPPGSEGRQQSLILLTAMQHGIWLTRNNVGALVDERGIPVRYGLANESKERNTVVKSADLIGMRSILIGPQHVGQVIAQFVSVECKKEDWQFNPKDKHQAAQRNWADFTTAKGGLAMFANGPESFLSQIGVKK